MKNYIHVNLSQYKQYCPFCIFNAENTKADCLKKNDLKRKLKLIFILFLSFSQPIFSITNYSIYDNYTTSNFRDNADLYNEIDFDNIDEVLLNAAVFFRTNEMRLEYYLPVLNYCRNLEESAMLHANDMVTENFFSHENFLDPTKESPSDRGRMTGVLNAYFAENIAICFGLQYEAERGIYTIDQEKDLFSYDPYGEVIHHHTYLSYAEALVLQWMNSPGHRDNILNKNALQLGCGSSFFRKKEFKNFAEFKAVQNFQWYEWARIK